MWRACDGVNPVFASVIRVMMLTGQRRGEVQGMRWDELSDDGKTWTIPASRSKNKKVHVVPLSAAARELIGTRFSEGTAFRVHHQRRPHARGGILQGQGRDRRRVKFKEEWRWHDIRRTVATGLQKLGVALPVTEAVLNHVSGSRSGIVGLYQRHDYADEKRRGPGALGGARRRHHHRHGGRQRSCR